MSIEERFKQRIEEVRVLLSTLSTIEAEQRNQPIPSFDVGRMLASSRASAYIMIYNSVEFALRQMLVSIRSDIESNETHFYEIIPYWRHDVLKDKYLSSLREGTDFSQLLLNISKTGIDICKWNESKISNLPFSGNIDQQKIFRMTKDMGIDFTPPPNTLGGSDLDNIRTRRNALAHGEESFEEAGSQVEADYLLQIVERVELFIITFMESVEDYRQRRGFLGSAVQSIQTQPTA